jgi:amino acid adenylation domain-containing protein
MHLPFPVDRTMFAGRTQSSSTVVRTSWPWGKENEPLHGTERLKALSFSLLFVFSRILQQQKLSIPLRHRGAAPDSSDGAVPSSTQGPASAWQGYAETTILDDATLASSFGSLRFSETPDPSCSQIGALLRESASAPGAPSEIDDRISVDYAFDGDQLVLAAHFDEARISRDSVQDLLEKVEVVCQQLAQDRDIKNQELVLVTDTAREVVPDLGLAKIPFPQIPVPAVFRSVALRNWTCPAIAGKGRTYSYGELWLAAARLAVQLKEQGLRAGDVVAISGLSSFGTVAAVLAVLTAGGVIVILDQALPEERLSRIARISQPRFTISVISPSAARPSRPNEFLCFDWPEFSAADKTEGEALNPESAIDERSSAYIFFTSGSTGDPKGVLGTHMGLAHFLEWQRSNFPIGPGDKSSQLTALSFDVVLRDVLFPLTSGACLCIPERETLFDARQMLRWILDSGITVMHSVPSLMKAWLQADIGERPFRSIKYIFFAGEPLTDSLLSRFKEASTAAANIVNLYGPTETTLARLSNRIVNVEPGVQPVGVAQPGVDAVIMRERRYLCGLWETGEIAIRTPFRSKGYLNQEELSRQVFIPNPFRNDPDDLIYFTGDLGRLRPDGKIEIFGRIDSQIKIRGVRIEPNEIESELAKIVGVKDAAVSARMTEKEEKVLVAVVVPDKPVANAADSERLSKQIRQHLKTKFHDAMVPSQFLFIGELPYLPNGKLNRKAIAALKIDVPKGEANLAKRFQGLDANLLPIVERIESALGRPVQNLDQSFVELGGDSLSYIHVSLTIEEHLGVLPKSWERQPLRGLLTRHEPGQTKSSWWCNLEVPLVFRALAICLVVVSHTETFPFIGTSILFVISGISFGKFLRPPILRSGSPMGVLRFIARFGIPAALWQVSRPLVTHRLWIPDIFLMGTLFQNPRGGHFTLWYLDILAASLLLLALVAWVEHQLVSRGVIRRLEGNLRFFTDLGLCAAGLLLGLLQVWTGWWNGVVGVSSVGPFKWSWMLMFGVAMSQAGVGYQKLVLTGFLGILALIQRAGPSEIQSVFRAIDSVFYASMIAIIWLERIPIPRVFKGTIVTVASASLFIYITNVAAITRVSPALHMPTWMPLQLAFALAVGIATDKAWKFASSAVMSLVRREKRSSEGSAPAGMSAMDG